MIGATREWTAHRLLCRTRALGAGNLEDVVAEALADPDCLSIAILETNGVDFTRSPGNDECPGHGPGRHVAAWFFAVVFRPHPAVMDLVDQAGIGIDAAVVRISSRPAGPSDDHVVAARIGHGASGRLADHPTLVLRVFEVLEDSFNLGHLRSYAVQGGPDCGLMTRRAYRGDLRRRGAHPDKKGQADQMAMPVRHVHAALGPHGCRIRFSRATQSWEQSLMQGIDSGIARTSLLPESTFTIVGSLFSSAALRALLLALACAPCPAIAGLAQSSVLIDVSREGVVRFNGYRLPREAEGMGVVMAPARDIATAAHVVWQAKSITVTDLKGTKVQARIVCIDQTVDIALLRVEHPPEHFATIRARPAVTGEPVGVVERSEPGETPHLASGFIGATRWTANGVPVPLIFSGIKGEKGMSGGGLFDAAGELLGIVIRIDGRLGYLSALPVAEFCTRFSRCAGGSPPAVPPQACEPGASPSGPPSRQATEPRAPLRRTAQREP